MRRIALTDGSGSWFDSDRAECYQEDLRWNGNNHISVATGSQWDHEELYRTANGRYILHSWSQWQGALDVYKTISDDDAYTWLLANGRPDAVRPEVDEAYDLDSDDNRRRSIRIPESLWAQAQGTGNATQLIKDLLSAHFAQIENRLQ